MATPLSEANCQVNTVSAQQVNQGAIKTVRRVTGLTAKRGYNSQSFYHGQDDMKALLNSYQDALVRLADR